MKKRYTSLILTTICLILSLTFSLSAFAETTTAPENIITDDISIYLEIHPEKMPSSLYDFYEQGILEMAEGAFTNDKEQTFVADKLLNGDFYFGFTTDPTYYNEPDELMILIPSEKSDYEENIKTPFVEGEDGSFVTDITTVEINADTFVYHNYDTAITWIEGYFIFSNSEEFLTDAVKSYLGECDAECKNPLSESQKYQDSNNIFSANNILNVFMDLEHFDISTDDFTEIGLFDDTLYETMEAISYSMDADNQQLTMEMFALYDPEKLEENGYDFSGDKELTLHGFLPSSNPIYFENATKVDNTIRMFKQAVDYQEIKQELFQETSVDLDKLLPGFENEIAIIIQDSGEIIPTLTMLSEISQGVITVNAELKLLTAYIWEQLQKDADRIEGNTVIVEDDESIVSITKGETTLGDSELTTFELKMELKETDNPYGLELPEDFFEMTVTYGITDDDILLFSTNSDISKQYGEGLANEDIEGLLDKNTDSIAYININNFNQFINDSLDKFQTIADNEIIDTADVKEFFNILLDPWHKMEAYCDGDNESMECSFIIDYDLQQMIDQYGSLGEAFKRMEQFFDNLDNLQTGFQDVRLSDWYADDVYYLSSQGVIEGYGYSDNKTFEPDQNINRAEFITLIVRLLINKDLVEDRFYFESSFTDVDDYAWYTDFIQNAFENGIISGYEDKTFHPNDPISRAEAAQIFANILDKYGIQVQSTSIYSESTFVDVNGTPWYLDAVKKVYENEIMQGTGNVFAPNRPINRAESARIIRKLLNIL